MTFSSACPPPPCETSEGTFGGATNTRDDKRDAKSVAETRKSRLAPPLPRRQASQPVHSVLPAAALRGLCVPCMAVLAAMSLVGVPARSEAAPNGIVTPEFFALTSECEDTLRTWKHQPRECALLGLGLDSVYLVLYPAVIASALLVTARTMPGFVQTAAACTAEMRMFAGLADAVENCLLIRMLVAGETAMSAMPAAVLAGAKFLVIGLALISWRRPRRRGWQDAALPRNPGP